MNEKRIKKKKNENERQKIFGTLILISSENRRNTGWQGCHMLIKKGKGKPKERQRNEYLLITGSNVNNVLLFYF